MKTTLLVMSMLLGACQYNTGNPSKQPDPEPRTTHSPLGLTPQDDIQLVVNPAWHNGATYNLTQNLKANPVQKGKLNNGE
jgi:hypothetical protein